MGGDVGGYSVGVVPGAVFVGILLLGAILSAVVIVTRSKTNVVVATERVYADVQTGQALLDARIRALTDALAHASPGDDLQLAGRALADARDRLAAAAELRTASPSLPVSRRCRWILLEGLAAAYAAGRLLGLDAGPQPPPPTEARLVASPVRVAVAGREHVALASYAPGFRFCYSGGVFDVGEVPGGWYAEPFWEVLLDGGGTRAATREPREAGGDAPSGVRQ